MKMVDAIFVGDIHLRENKPVCRKDDWEQVMIKKLKFIRDYAMEYDVPVICAGDVFHNWNSSPWMLSFAIEHLPDNMITIAGNHDIPRHNMQLIEWSAINVISKANKIKLLNSNESYVFHSKNGKKIIVIPFPFGSNLNIDEIGGDDAKFTSKENAVYISVIHKFIYGKDCQDWEKNIGTNADYLLSQMTHLRRCGGKISTVLVGDNHKAFEIKKSGDLLLNPGSIFRMTSAQKHFKPRFYLWNIANEYEAVYFPVDENDISDEHIVDKNISDERIKIFVNKMREDVEFGLDFKVNLKEYIEKNKIKIGVKSKIWQTLM